ncbi:MAG: hypothetical protein M1837_001561 [Sclerophora amabilis]|nr:MAG: hypothetical protein M1837_001561 [Sclerophora amabilis]
MLATSTTSAPASKTASRLTSSPFSKTGDDPDRVDQRLSFLIRHTLPKSPYLLSVPTDKPYHLSSYQEHNWRVGGPFAADEEELQYMSFLPRDSDDSLIVARGNWDEMEKDAPSKNGVRSGTTTPLNGKTKKISLSAYKSKPRGEAMTANSTGKGSGDDAKETKAIEVMEQKPGPEAPAAGAMGKGSKPEVERNRDTTKPASSQRSPPHGQKRPSNAMDNSKPPKTDGRDDNPSKKPRTTSSAPRNDLHVSTTPKSAGTNGNKLPPLLSPTLPASIEEELAKLQSSTTSPTSSAGHKKNQSSTSSSSDARLKANGVESTAAGSKHERSPQVAGKSPRKGPTAPSAKKVETTHRPSAPETKPSTKTTKVIPNGNAGSAYFDTLRGGGYHSPSLGPTSKPKTDKVETKGRKVIVRMKYGKEHRKTVERLLKTRPQPQKNREPPSTKKEAASEDQIKRDNELQKKDFTTPEKGRVAQRDDRLKDKTKGDSQPPRKPNAESMEKARSQPQPSAGEKRPRAVEEQRGQDQSTKRQKAPEKSDVYKNPRTPVPAAIKSPVVSHQSSAEKSQIPTPSKDIKAKAMRRVESSDVRATTPQGVGDSVGQNNRSTSEARQNEMRDWRTENREKRELGRAIKLQAEKLLRCQTEGNPLEDKAFKRGAALAVESILCYILAFMADDNSRRLMSQPGTVENWRSLIPLWNYVERKCQPIPHLHGLCLQLGAVVREVVHFLDRNSLTNDPQPAGNAPEDRQQRINDLFANDRARERLWQEGWKKLTADTIRDEYPQTWGRRLTDLGAVSIRRERLSPLHWGEGYRCPLMSNVTTPIEAVRMGVVFLNEWAGTQGIEWRDQLGVL